MVNKALLLTLDDVAERMGVHVKTVRRRMAESKTAGIRPGWLELGGSVIRWREADLDRWLTEIDAWQRSESERTRTARDGRSDGAPSPASSGGASAPTSAR